MSRRRWWIVGTLAVVAVLAVAGVLAWRLFLRDTTTPQSIDDALARFRASTTMAGASTTAAAATTSAAATTTTTLPPRLPDVGVYIYRTTGFEAVDALNGARHDYPPESTITVTGSGCGVRLRWAPLAERYEDWDLCRAADGALITSGYTSFHRFFGQDDRADYVCPPASTYLPARLEVGGSWTLPCTSGNTVDTTQWSVVALEPMTIGGVTVDAVQLRGEDTFTDPDGSHGATGIDLWLDTGTGLVLRRVEHGQSTNSSAIGDIHYEEQLTLELVSRTPRT